MLEALITVVLGTAMILFIAVPLALYYAWTASYLWLWFIVPVFNAPPLTTLQLWGISLFLGILRPRLSPDVKGQEKEWGKACTVILLGPLFYLGFGYAIKFWWM